MKSVEAIIRIVDALFENGYLRVKSVGEVAKIPEGEVPHILRELQFLDYVFIKNGKVYPSSQIYSLLFDAVLVSEGLDQFFKKNFQDAAVRENKTIPGLLVPILLLRAASPFVGDILKDLKEEGKLQIDKNKEDFLFDYFSRRPIDFKPLKNWREIYFDSEEFYDIWILLNEKLIKRIGIPTDDKNRTVADNRSKRAPMPSTVVAGSSYVEAPEVSMEKAVAITERSTSRTIIKTTQECIPSNLRKLRAIDISISKMLRFIQEQKSRSKGLVITKYSDALSWEFVGEKIEVPTMFLLKDGIYIEERIRREFTELEIFNQANYLEECIKISYVLYGHEKMTQRKKESA